MSGGYFENTKAIIAAEMLSEELYRLTKKQWEYKLDGASPNKDNGEWDYKLSANTLNKIELTCETLHKAAKMAKLVDYLLSQDISESNFTVEWEENILYS